MANAFKNTTLVTRYAIKEFLNALVLGAKVDRQVDTSRVFSGGEYGETIYIRRPVYFSATTGEAISAGQTEDIQEGYVPVTCDQRYKVVFSLSSKEMTLDTNSIRERFIRPAMQELAQNVESALADQYKYVPNLVGSAGTSPATFLVMAQARAKLSNYGVPLSDRYAFVDPDSMVTLADGLKAVFPEKIATRALKEAEIGRYAGFDMYECQSIKTHTVGNRASGTPLVTASAASATSDYADVKDTWTQTLYTDGWSASVNTVTAGDVFTIADVYQVNRRSRTSTGNLQQFVCTAAATAGATGGMALTISPPIIASGSFQTVDAGPADNAALTFVGTSSTAYKRSLAFHKNAMTLAFAQLDVPSDGASAARETYQGVSIRAVRQYNVSIDKTIFRFDILYGIKMQNPEFACQITS